MSNRNKVRVKSTYRGIRRMKAAFNNPKTRNEISMAGAKVVFRMAHNAAPVGTRRVKRYKKRSVKGRANRPSVIRGITQPGNTKRSMRIIPRSFSVSVGPRIRSSGSPVKDVAFYAAAYHKTNPWLSRSMSRSQATAMGIMQSKVLRLIKIFDQ